MLSRSILVVLGLLYATGAAAAQETAAVFEFEGVGLAQSQADAATQIFRAELGATGKFSVLPRADVEAKLAAQGIQNPVCHAVGCAIDFGQVAGVTSSIIGTLTLLGNRVTTEVQLVDVASKQVAFSDRFTAASLDDLDAALRKLAVALSTRRKIESEVDRFPVSAEETADAARKRSFITVGGAFGSGLPIANSFAKVNSINQLLFVTRYEANRYVVETSIGGAWGSGGNEYKTSFGQVVHDRHVQIVPIDVSLHYLFSRRGEFTPFVGGGIGMHFISSQSTGGQEYIQGGTSFAYNGAFGVYAFQSYDFRLSLEARYSMLFSDAFGGDQNFHHQIGFLLGVTRKLERTQTENRGGCGPRFPW